MNVLISLNDFYVRYYSVMLQSLFENNKSERIVVYIIRDRFPSDEGIEIINKIVGKFKNGELKVVHIDKELLEKFKGFSLCEWPLESYFRLFSPWILDESVERIIYLDGDIIINKDISAFYHMNLRKKLFAACRDISLSPYNVRLDKNNKNEADFLLKYTRSANKNTEREYYNAGVLLTDAQSIRTLYKIDELIDFIYLINEYMKYPDQDILNFFFADEICSAEPMKYNCQIGGIHYREESNIMANACIMHFTGIRPWDDRYRIHYSSAIPGDIWWRYALRAGIVSQNDYRRWKIVNFLKTTPWMMIYDAKKKIFR